MPIAISKTLLFLKKYWYVPVVFIAAFITYFVFRSKSTALLEFLQKNHESYKKEINELEKIAENEKKRKDVAHKEYNEKVEVIDKTFEKELEEIDQAKKERIEELLAEHANDIDSLTNKIAELGDFVVTKGK